VLGGLWAKLTRGRRESAVEREATMEKMSPEEREFIEEPLEDTQADDFAAGHLGGIDPERLLADGAPPADDVPPS
jgi:hypothetical protein